MTSHDDPIINVVFEGTTRLVINPGGGTIDQTSLQTVYVSILTIYNPNLFMYSSIMTLDGIHMNVINVHSVPSYKKQSYKKHKFEFLVIRNGD